MGIYTDNQATQPWVCLQRYHWRLYHLDEPNAGSHLIKVHLPAVISGQHRSSETTSEDNNDIVHGFIYNKVTGDYTALDYPNAAGGTWPNGISGNSIAGFYTDTHGATHGFINNGRTLVTLDDPDCGPAFTDTEPYGISGNTIVGGFRDSNGNCRQLPRHPRDHRSAWQHHRHGFQRPLYGRHPARPRPRIGGVTITLQQIRGGPIPLDLPSPPPPMPADIIRSTIWRPALTASRRRCCRVSFSWGAYNGADTFTLVKGEDSFDNDFPVDRNAAAAVRSAKRREGRFSTTTAGGASGNGGRDGFAPGAGIPRRGVRGVKGTACVLFSRRRLRVRVFLAVKAAPKIALRKRKRLNNDGEGCQLVMPSILTTALLTLHFAARENISLGIRRGIEGAGSGCGRFLRWRRCRRR